MEFVETLDYQCLEGIGVKFFLNVNIEIYSLQFLTFMSVLFENGNIYLITI